MTIFLAIVDENIKYNSIFNQNNKGSKSYNNDEATVYCWWIKEGGRHKERLTS